MGTPASYPRLTHELFTGRDGPDTKEFDYGGVAERLNALVLKTSVPSRYRGFESHPLRSSLFIVLIFRRAFTRSEASGRAMA